MRGRVGAQRVRLLLGADDVALLAHLAAVAYRCAHGKENPSHDTRRVQLRDKERKGKQIDVNESVWNFSKCMNILVNRSYPGEWVGTGAREQTYVFTSMNGGFLDLYLYLPIDGRTSID